jgi:hypothetical protein
MPSLFRAPFPLCLTVAAGCALIAGCQSTKKAKDDGAKPPGGNASTETSGAVNVNFLLSMTWGEAREINPHHLEIPPNYKVAADEITVLKTGAGGEPLRARARGHVFMQVDFREQLVALGQEALIGSDGEVILRGKPLLKRGRSLVEGLDDTTVFYIKGTRLQVVGRHRLSKQNTGGDSFPVAPTWSRSWKEGPNPLLPALSPESVPQGLRANPFLPMPGSSDSPEEPRKEN